MASPPSRRSSPQTALILALSGMIGLGLGVMAGLAREQMNRQIHTRSQIEELLGVSCLAVLSDFSKGIKQTFSRMQPHRSSNAFRHISEAPPFSATAEALRYIKVAIDLHPAGAKIIGLVSALPGEGKTTVATSLAAFLVKSGAKTLLIDADLRNPSMSRSLGHTDTPGLINMVADRSEYRDLVISDPKYKFDFLPASTRIKPVNSSDILTSNAVKEMLKSASTEYDYVIVDLPPILPVVDVKASAQMFDAFIMVIEWGSTSSDEVIKAAGTSQVLAERLLGTVLNKADEAAMRRIEGYSDRRYEYYSSETDHAAT